MDVAINHEEIIALFRQASVDGEFSGRCFRDAVLEVKRLYALILFVARVVQESFDELLVILNAIVEEEMNFVFRVVHREDFVEELLEEGRWVLDENRDKDCEGSLLLFVFDVVVSAPETLTVGECVCKIISVVVEVNFTRTVAVDERWVGVEFFVEKFGLAYLVNN